MKMHTTTDRSIHWGLALALLVAFAFFSPLGAQSAKDAEDGKASKEEQTEGNLRKQCRAMQQERKQMMEKMKAQDAELNKQVAKLKDAPEGKKVTIMANIITRMVKQRSEMHARMARQQEEMMQHMMQHMEMGKDSLTQCPMMKRMKAMKDKSGDKPTEETEEQ